MLCSETMVGRDGNASVGLPVDQLMSLMKTYNRI
jgi:hypothetical protein